MAPTPKDSYLTLHTGAHMPKLGLGTWAQTNVVNKDQHDPHALAVRPHLLGVERALL